MIHDLGGMNMDYWDIEWLPWNELKSILLFLNYLVLFWILVNYEFLLHFF